MPGHRDPREPLELKSPQIHVEAIGDEAWAEQMGARRISIPLREMTSKSSPQVIIITLWVE
jgi:hypothetical protein